VRRLEKGKKKRKKVSALALTRRLIQAASFVLFPGLFISTFSAIKSICSLRQLWDGFSAAFYARSAPWAIFSGFLATS
jgi:hypothetical protein